MGLKLGSADVTALYIGSDPVTAVYLGSTKVWPTGPAVRQIATSTESPNSASHSVSLPSNKQSGDKLIIVFVVDSLETVTTPSGWTREAINNIDEPTIAIFSRTCDGTEGSSVSISTSTAERSAHITLALTGVTSLSASIYNGGVLDNDPNPPNLSFTGGKLWIAVGAWDDGTTYVTGYPDNPDESFDDNQTTVRDDSAYGVGVALATLTKDADSLNPWKFLLSGTEYVCGATIGVK